MFVLSILTFILNMSLIAIFDDSMKEEALISILLSSLFAVLQLVNNSKANWDWVYIIILTALSLLFSAVSIFTTELLFMRFIWLGELVFFCGFILLSLRKQKKG